LSHRFDRIEQRSLFTEIVQCVRDAIVFGDVKLGEHLSESIIARQMEVSRIPLREALIHLAKEGVVVHIQGRGFFVTSFSPEDIREVFSLRSMLECIALTRSIPLLQSEDFKQLENLIDQQDKAIQRGQYDLLTRLDMRFHEYFCAKANHARLLKTWRNNEVQCQMLINRRFLVFSNETTETVIKDHLQLFDAVHHKDVPLALEITKSISNRVAEECVRMIQDVSSEGGTISKK